MISAVSRRYHIHPQTLRLYEREGLLQPSRTEGNTRLYSDEDLERLALILNLTRELRVDLAGVEIILNMRARMERMQAEIERFLELLGREIEKHGGRGGTVGRESALVPVPRRTVVPLSKRGKDGKTPSEP
ncbi:MAG: MerR family transcriptional regulator [Acidobacteria bacterium]|nr:MerR family transcriptional regulator [Acidobacteriota bacterium]